MTILRPIELVDLDPVYAWRNDPSITKHLVRLGLMQQLGAIPSMG